MYICQIIEILQENISVKQERGTKSVGREIGIVKLNKESLTEKQPSEEDLKEVKEPSHSGVLGKRFWAGGNSMCEGPEARARKVCLRAAKRLALLEWSKQGRKEKLVGHEDREVTEQSRSCRPGVIHLSTL